MLVVAITVLASVACARGSAESAGAAGEPGVELPELDPTALVNVRKSAGDTRGGPGATRRELTWTFDEAAFGSTDVVISIPAGPADARYPVLIALHGRGESLKGSRRGARGWLDDYELGRGIARLRRPPLTRADFRHFVRSERLRRINRALRRQPFGDLIVVCPFLPDVLRGDDAFSAAGPLAAFIVDELLPRVYGETPAIGGPASTGIDGVSLGGRAALLVGFTRPKAFRAVGALQAALDRSEIQRFAALGARALEQNPELELRLLTSDRDHFLRVNRRLSEAFQQRGVRHRFLSVSGTHGYRFNRGPGGLEMLLFHDRALRGVTPE